MRSYYHFTLTNDARRQVPHMVYASLLEEFKWQQREYQAGSSSIKRRAKRIQELILAEVEERNKLSEFQQFIAEGNTAG